MEEQPSKRRGRPRKDVVVLADDAKVSPAPNHDAGHREAGDARPTAQADDAGSAQVGDWLAFVATVDRVVNGAGHEYVSAAFHPSPMAAVIESAYPVPVSVGEKAIKTKHGQILTFQALGHPAK